MKINRIIMIILVLLINSLATANDIKLAPELKAKATVIRDKREGKWEKTLLVEFPQRRRVLSTNDGLIDVMAVANHAAQPELWSYVCEVMKTPHEVGGKVYMRMIREKMALHLGLRSEDISMLGTAVDMDNLAVVTKAHHPFIVTALVTAGAKGNAIRTGVDEGVHIEADPAWEKLSTAKEPRPGTINMIVLTNARLTDGAMARALLRRQKQKQPPLRISMFRAATRKMSRQQAQGLTASSLFLVQ